MRSRGYCYTLNNYTDEEVTTLKGLDVRYHILGYETGEQGTPHIQGYIYFNTLKSCKQVSTSIPRAHIEPQKGTTIQASEYCKKGNNFEEIGTLPNNSTQSMREKRKRKNLLCINEKLSDLVLNGDISINEVTHIKRAKLVLDQEKPPYAHDTVRGEWIYGPPGTGKSHTARAENPGAYIKPQDKWWCDYAGQEVVILDDLDTNVLGHYLKIWADKYACTGQTKGGQINLRHKKFVVTSNYTPSQLWDDDPVKASAIERRFNLRHFLIKYNP